MPEPGGSPFAKPEPDSTAVAEHGWKVVLLNDDVTPIDVVVFGLQQACGVSEEVAEMIAVEAHNEGAAVARNGLTQADAEATVVRLKALTRIPRLCPGVGCHAEKDE